MAKVTHAPSNAAKQLAQDYQVTTLVSDDPPAPTGACADSPPLACQPPLGPSAAISHCRLDCKFSRAGEGAGKMLRCSL